MEDHLNLKPSKNMLKCVKKFFNRKENLSKLKLLPNKHNKKKLNQIIMRKNQKNHQNGKKKVKSLEI